MKRKKPLNKCNLCGKFRKVKDLTMFYAEYDEEWLECIHCMSNGDLEFHNNAAIKSVAK